MQRPIFVTPESTATVGNGLGFEYRRAGYSLVGSGSYYWRTNWQPWGNGDDYDPSQRDYLRYQLSLSKDFYFGLHKIHLNGAYFGGKDLDRFSMYQFGLFDDTRIHGVPGSGVRFPELAMVRGSYSLNVFERYRIDLFLEQALGRDPFGTGEWLPVTGIGLGFNLRGPWRTMVRGDLGKSFLPDEYAGVGSFVMQIQFLKPL